MPGKAWTHDRPVYSKKMWIPHLAHPEHIGAAGWTVQICKGAAIIPLSIKGCRDVPFWQAMAGPSLRPDPASDRETPVSSMPRMV